jgi:hypothetical protein
MWVPGLNTRAPDPVSRPSSSASRAWERSSRPRNKANLACSRVSQVQGPARSNSKTCGPGQGNLAAPALSTKFTSFTIFEGTSEIQRMLIVRAVTGLDVR